MNSGKTVRILRLRLRHFSRKMVARHTPLKLHKRSNDAGMTMVEVLVATGLLAGALLALTGLFVFGMRNNVAAKHNTLMGAHIQDKMEELKQITLGELIGIQTEVETNSAPKVDYFVSGAWQTTLNPGDDPHYRREWEVHDKTLISTNADSDDFNNTVKEIQVRVFAYKYKKGTELRSMEMRTFRRIN
ncbi:hypothetical protein ACFLU6_06010 [Acidobacteriota bacterium]